jgi:hypothetical protein
MLAARCLVTLLPAFHKVFVMILTLSVQMILTPIVANDPKADNNHHNVFGRIKVLKSVLLPHSPGYR